MFEKEVDYRLAKWVLLNMEKTVISFEEMQLAWDKIREYYNPPFLELENMNSIIGDGVIINDR